MVLETLSNDSNSTLASTDTGLTKMNGGSQSKSQKIETRVKDALEQLEQDSFLFRDPNDNDSLDIARYNWEDVKVGEKLGQGGFNCVLDVELLRGSHSDTKPRYAIKYLKPALHEPGNASRLKQGAVDLAVEGRFLSVLRHEHLVRLHAVSTVMNDKMFLVMDRLDHTLLQRIGSWKERDDLLAKRYRKESHLLQHRRYRLNERLQVAKDIAKVLQYLHENKVVYRDLKPENIGFSSEGIVKLFDLGLAKEMKNPLQNGKYQLTGQTGSWIYMAPEVAKHWAYDGMVDVYSFGILLWEVISLEEAFANLTKDQHMQQVVSGDVRPPMTKWWPTDLQWIMKKCWSYFAANRPKWSVVTDTLQEVMDDDPEVEQAEDTVRGFGSLRAMSLRNRNSERLGSPLASPKGSSGRWVPAAPPRVGMPPPSPTMSPSPKITTKAPSPKVRGRVVRQRSLTPKAFGFLKGKK